MFSVFIGAILNVKVYNWCHFTEYDGRNAVLMNAHLPYLAVPLQIFSNTLKFKLVSVTVILSCRSYKCGCTSTEDNLGD